MKLYKMIEIYLKYDNMHIFRVINAFIYINNYLNLCINSMLSTMTEKSLATRSLKCQIRYDIKSSKVIEWSI